MQPLAVVSRHLTLDELQAGLAAMGDSPIDHGTLEMIVCRPASGERILSETGMLDLSEGLVGDNWYTRGSKMTPDGTAHPEMQITLMNSRVIQLFAQDRACWAWAGDQLYVDIDLSIDNLPPGQRIAIGGAVLEISTLPHTGCAKFTDRFGHDATRFVNLPEGKHARRRGVNTQVVQPGAITVGDTIIKL